MEMSDLLYLPETFSAGNWTFVLTGCAAAGLDVLGKKKICFA
jgi:hypothetical protein